MGRMNDKTSWLINHIAVGSAPISDDRHLYNLEIIEKGKVISWRNKLSLDEVKAFIENDKNTNLGRVYKISQREEVK